MSIYDTYFTFTTPDECLAAFCPRCGAACVFCGSAGNGFSCCAGVPLCAITEADPNTRHTAAVVTGSQRRYDDVSANVSSTAPNTAIQRMKLMRRTRRSAGAMPG